jgi:hypothetical protein
MSDLFLHQILSHDCVSKPAEAGEGEEEAEVRVGCPKFIEISHEICQHFSGIPNL